jgi:hypothetical protein
MRPRRRNKILDRNRKLRKLNSLKATTLKLGTKRMAEHKSGAHPLFHITDELTRLNVPLGALIQACLLYTDTEDKPDAQSRRVLEGKFSEAKPISTTLATLYRSLSANFWSQLFITRPEYVAIRSNLGFDGITLIKGYAGCGKSTLLRKFFHDYRADGTTAFIILDPIRSPSFFFGNRDEIREHLSQAIYQFIRDKFSKTEPNFDNLFQRHRIFRSDSPSYLEFREDHGLVQIPDFANVVFTPDIINDEAILRKSLKQYDRLFLLLDFLRDAQRQVFVAFDNIDQLAGDKNNIIIELCSELVRGSPPHCYPLMAIRENYDHRWSNEFSAVENVFRLTDSRATAVFDVTSFETLLNKFCDTRLGFAAEYIRANKLSQNPEIDKALSKNFEVIKDLIYLLKKADCLKELSDWENHSIRSSSVRIYNMCVDIAATAGDSPVIEEIKDCAKDEKRINEYTLREARNITYRYFSINPRRRDKLKTIQPFAASRPAAGVGLDFLPLRVLVYLQKRENPGSIGIARNELVSIKSLVDFFSQFDVDPTSVRDAVLDLALSRGSNAYGLIYVDVDQRQLERLKDAGKDKIDDLKIGLLPSGLYYLNTLLFQCEHIFWVAVMHPVFKTRVNFKVDSLGDQIYSEIFRAKVAIDFICKYIVPIFEREFDHILKVSRERRRGFNPLIAYCRAFDVGNGKKFFVERMLNSIETFARGSLEYSRYKHEIAGLTSEARKRFSRIHWRIDQALGRHDEEKLS